MMPWRYSFSTIITFLTSMTYFCPDRTLGIIISSQLPHSVAIRAKLLYKILK